MTRGRRTDAGVMVDAGVALVLFGCIPVVIRLISANPYTIGIFRLVVAAAGMAVIAAARREIRRIPAIDLLRLAVIGIFFFAHWLLYFFSIKASSASIGAIGLSTYGIDLLILGAIFHHERLHPIDVAAVLVAITGAVAIVPRFDLRNETAVGMLLASASAVFYASLPILHQRWAHLSTTTRALGQFFFALLLFLCFLPRSEWDLKPVDWGGLLFLAIGSTLVGHTLWVRVTTRLSPSLTSIIYYGNLPVAIVLSVLVLHEPVTVRTLVGASLIVAGGIIGLSRHRKL